MRGWTLGKRFFPIRGRLTDGNGALLGGLRWRHPACGMVSLGECIPLAEETGLILLVGDWVSREACQSAVRWSQAGLPLSRIAVNVSIQQLRQDNFVERVHVILEETPVDPAWIEFDITESALMDNSDESISRLLDLQVVAEGIEQESPAVYLRGHGCDFGPGFPFSRPFPESELIEMLRARPEGVPLRKIETTGTA